MKNLAFIIGTRPEAIKLAPVILSARQNGMRTYIISTGQHKDLVEPALDAFGLEPDHNLALSDEIPYRGNSLAKLTGQLLTELHYVFVSLKMGNWDTVVVQGDTTSAFIGALLGFYHGIKIVHIEAGLRSLNKDEPFPEEMNRKLITQLADYHFCPTRQARSNLLWDGVSLQNTYLVGNTVVDALQMIVDSNYKIKYDQIRDFQRKPNSKLVMLTLHRRENWELLPDIFRALNELFAPYENTKLLIPAHPNRLIKGVIKDVFKYNYNVFITDALDYLDFINLLARCYFVVTDSGGIQEEAPYLGKPVLVVRRQTERPEGVKAGVAKLIGVNPATVANEVKELLHNDNLYKSMQKYLFNDYGNGNASQLIINTLKGGIDCCPPSKLNS